MLEQMFKVAFYALTYIFAIAMGILIIGVDIWILSKLENLAGYLVRPYDRAIMFCLNGLQTFLQMLWSRISRWNSVSVAGKQRES